MAEPQPATSWEACLLRVAGMLHTAPADLPSQWTHLVAQAVRDAHQEICMLLAAKGYSAAQIATPPDAMPYWVERLGAVLALQRGSALSNYPTEQLKALDPRESIEKAGLILIAGVAQAPDVTTSEVGGVRGGRVAAAQSFLDTNSRGSWGAGTDWVW